MVPPVYSVRARGPPTRASRLWQAVALTAIAIDDRPDDQDECRQTRDEAQRIVRLRAIRQRQQKPLAGERDESEPEQREETIRGSRERTEEQQGRDGFEREQDAAEKRRRHRSASQMRP